MRRNNLLSIALGACMSLISSLAFSQTANVQVIHNCADPAADTVDIYVNGNLALDNFAFRTATPFLQLPSGVTLNIGVAPKNSTSVADTIKSFAVGPLTTDSNYIVVASGVVANGFAANPNSLSTSFTLKVITDAVTAGSGQNVSLGVFHGATDAPGVDVKVTNGPALVTNIEYGSFAGYLSVPATWYPISIYPTGANTAVANYVADLSGLSGGAAVVIASGFLNPSANNNGPAFGLFAVLTDGTVIELPAQTFANVQIAHNCAAPAADSVDVYLDGVKAIPNFKFRTATPFIPILASVNHSVAVAPANSSSVAQAIATFNNINLTANQNYIVVASGVVGSGFASNPSGLNTGFDLKVIANAETAAATSGKVDLAIFHGSTDAPAVSVAAEGGSTLVQGLHYGSSTSYLSLPANNYTLDIQDSSQMTVLARYIADVSGIADSAGVVYASGFL
ncbi:MAG TPA: DUF4397 domain-containing protein, partial [Chitinophagales bacterium]|nr:DUF4397 domain-containing protein [Chitinophagales bacterium]